MVKYGMPAPGQMFAPDDPRGTKKPRAAKIEVPVVISEGEKRIQIEYEAFNFSSKSESTKEQWRRLVADIVTKIKPVLTGLKGKTREEAFFAEVKKEIWKRFTITTTSDAYLPLAASLQANINKMDCDNTSFLIYDVASRLHIPLSFVCAPTHVVLQSESLVFDTLNDGQWYSVSDLKKKFPFYQVLKADQIQVLSYAALGGSALNGSQIDNGLLLLEKGHSICPDNFTLNYDLAIGYASKKDWKKALDYNTRAIEIYSGYFLAYSNRAAVYFNIANAQKEFNPTNYLHKALEDADTAIGIDPSNARIYQVRSLILDKLASYEPAHADEYKKRAEDDRRIFQSLTP